ncbi:hypothetical protein CK501_14535 [Halovibrio salipaludis]|uniref:Uncharacterized protein n=1 Tax=Halovibrio salipaludis TaxID=2032626 RepID=A0A2A2EZ58_9GAMM|nr:hypothetical protein [Halovibrio salipaludis]PAU77675.1 hypothetical protein CK501_14535 [Halovibrio salipaludis]
MQEAIQEAKEGEQAMQQAGYDQAALDEAGRRGFENAEFEHSEDETPAVMEEFYPEATEDVDLQRSQKDSDTQAHGIKERLATSSQVYQVPSQCKKA